MKMEKVGLVPASPGANLGGAQSTSSKSGENLNVKAALKAAENSGIRTLRDREFGYLLGDPRIIIEPRGDNVFVYVRPRPWSWTDVDKEFLFGCGAERYARKLLDRVHVEGEKKHRYRERMKAARIREREARS